MIYHNDDSVLGCIDQHYFKDPQTGRDFITWKTDKLVPFSTSVVFIQEIEESGMYFKEGSEKVKILEVETAEEMFTNEGMWLMFREGTYFLFYSTSLFELPTYRMMVAGSKDILGPYTKHEVPVVETDWERYNNGLNSTFEGPGHGSVVVDTAGDWWLIYHSWRWVTMFCVTCNGKDADIDNTKFVRILILNISEVFSDHFFSFMGGLLPLDVRIKFQSVW